MNRDRSETQVPDVPAGRDEGGLQAHVVGESSLAPKEGAQPEAELTSEGTLRISVSDALWIAGVPVWAYAIAYSFASGYYAAYNLPPTLARIHPSILLMALLSVMWCLMCMVLAGLKMVRDYRIRTVRPKTSTRRLLRLILYFLSFVVTVAVLWMICVYRTGLFLLSTSGLLVAITIVYLWTKGTRWLPAGSWRNNVVALIALLCLSLGLAGGIGWFVARDTTRFLVVESIRADSSREIIAVVIDAQDSRLICCGVGKHDSGTFFVIPYPDGDKAHLRSVVIPGFNDWYQANGNGPSVCFPTVESCSE